MVRVKICGITNREDALFCIDHGADALGFVFYKKSPRYIDVESAREIVKTLPPFVQIAGLFVNEDKCIVNEIYNHVRLDLLQFHGDEDEDYVNGFHQRKVKAFRVKDSVDEAVFKDYDVDAYLLDTHSKDVYGGSGENFDWGVLSDRKFDKPIILAGGLTVDNIVDAVNVVRPYAVDVSSGVEKEKGIKDSDKVRKFIIRAKHGRYEK